MIITPLFGRAPQALQFSKFGMDVGAPDQMLPEEYAQGLKGVEPSNRDEALEREISRQVARGESLDGLLGYISGLLVEVLRHRPGRCRFFFYP